MKRRLMLTTLMIIVLVINGVSVFGVEQSTEIKASITRSNDLPTKQPITVTINYPENARFKEYSIDGGARNAYSGSFVVAKNCTISVKYTIHSDGSGDVTHSENFEITNIIKEIKILELQPYQRYNLASKENYTKLNNLGYEVTLDSIPVKGFVSMIEPINGNYDIIYIGNLHLSGKTYCRFEGTPSSIPMPSSSYEDKYSGADITNKRAKEIKEFIDSGQMVIMADTIFGDSYKDTKIYKNFIDYYNNRDSYPNIHFFSTGGLGNIDIAAGYEAANKKPLLELTSTPTPYKNINNKITFNDSLSLQYGFNIFNSNSNGPMDVNLYLDVNGDGLFKDYELVNGIKGVYSEEGYAINHTVDRSLGLQPWMIEVIDLNTGTKNRSIGYTALKDEAVEIRVLQILPKSKDKSTLEIGDISSSKLKRDGEYSITVDYITHADFNSNRPDLNGVYDMIIIGFADAFLYVDIDDEVALSKLKKFIATGQGVLFTHDILSFQMNKSSGWSIKLTKTFRDMIGQNIYKYDAFNSEIFDDTGDDYISNSKKSVGFSREALDRASKGGFSTTGSTNKLNEGFLTMYPFVLPQNLPVATTHYQYYQLDLEDEDVIPWFTLRNNGYNIYDGRNDYYTYTKGNITYSGTGHSPPTGSAEHEFFVNTMLKAVKGANHAPHGDIYGIVDNSFISVDDESIAFKIKAHDIDLDDSEVYGDIYIDKNDNGIFEDSEKVITYGEANPIEIDTFKDVEISIADLPDTLKNMGIQLKIYDDQGAEGYATRTVKRVKIPMIKVTSDAEGCLIGDSVGIDFNVLPDNMDTDVTFSEISLEVTVPSELTSSYGAQWSKTGDKLVTNISDIVLKANSTDMNNKELGITVGASSNGEYDLDYKLMYKVTTSEIKGHTFEQVGKTSVDVKSGTISIEVKDKKSRAIKNTKVFIDGNYKDKTGNTGFYQESGLSSDSYRVEIEPPAGYELKATDDDPTPAIRNVNLSYDSPSVAISYEVSGDCITDVKILDVNDSPNSEVVKMGKVLGKIRFRLLRPVKSLDIDLGTDMSNYNITLLDIKNITDDVVLDESKYSFALNTISFRNSLDAKTYEANIIIDMHDNPINISDTRYVEIVDASVVEPHFNEGDSDEYTINTKLTLTVVKDPNIK